MCRRAKFGRYKSIQSVAPEKIYFGRENLDSSVHHMLIILGVPTTVVLPIFQVEPTFAPSATQAEAEEQEMTNAPSNRRSFV